jgi:hypothetical protein
MWEWFSNNWIWIVFVAWPIASVPVVCLIGRFCGRWKKAEEEVVLNHTVKAEGPEVHWIDFDSPDWKAQLEGVVEKTDAVAKHGDR